jgi:hypothetical protein
MLKNGTFTFTPKDIEIAGDYLNGSRESQLQAIRSLALAIGDAKLAYRCELMDSLVQTYATEPDQPAHFIIKTFGPEGKVIIRFIDILRGQLLQELSLLLGRHYEGHVASQLYLQTKETLQQETEYMED